MTTTTDHSVCMPWEEDCSLPYHLYIFAASFFFILALPSHSEMGLYAQEATFYLPCHVPATHTIPPFSAPDWTWRTANSLGGTQAACNPIAATATCIPFYPCLVVCHLHYLTIYLWVHCNFPSLPYSQEDVPASILPYLPTLSWVGLCSQHALLPMRPATYVPVTASLPM